MDPGRESKCVEKDNHKMTASRMNANETAPGAPNAPAPSARKALAIAIAGAAIAAAATVAVLRKSFGTGTEALLGAVALAAFGVMAYGLIQAVLAVVDTAGERRRQDREVSERRKGDRARKPKE